MTLTLNSYDGLVVFLGFLLSTLFKNLLTLFDFFVYLKKYLWYSHETFWLLVFISLECFCKNLVAYLYYFRSYTSSVESTRSLHGNLIFLFKTRNVCFMIMRLYGLFNFDLLWLNSGYDVKVSMWDRWRNQSNLWRH